MAGKGQASYSRYRLSSTPVRNANQTACDCDVIHEEVVNRVKAQMPHGQDFYTLANLYKTFSDSTRLRILWALNASEMCVCDLAVLLNMTKSAISHQLKSLRMANLVKYDKRGKVVYYSLTDSHVKDIFVQGFEHIKE
ncbi:MAG: metalloregulator ArsR/SmtB family transcription factor [Oscillospiraceae bacterium]|nr:metalloregulator ArsR/SmtB family transcription factor [Oscillospiraceae bacterium]